MKRWLVLDHETDQVVDFWWGDTEPPEWETKYPHIDADGYERYSIESEYVTLDAVQARAE